jgi:MinD-like ATPase involved in chromosome partitioning or flagellar assembly
MSGAPALKRGDVHPAPVVDGRPVHDGAPGRVRRRLQRLRVSRHEREEAELERRICSHPGVTRPNTIALISPKGGVGKTTSTYLVGNLLATHLKLRAIAVDANPDFGTLARLAPDCRRSARSLQHLLDDADAVNTAAELTPYVSRLPSGLHVLAAPHDASRLGPTDYGELLAFIASFYEVVLLDLGTGIAGPLARLAICRADQVVLVTTPDWVTSSIVLEARSHLRHDRTIVAVNRYRTTETQAIEEHLHHTVTIPHDDQLATMLDTGTYALEALGRPTRTAIKRLGLAVAEQLV